MSFALPPVKAKPEHLHEFGGHNGDYGITEVMTNGITKSQSDLQNSHPLMKVEPNFRPNQSRMNMAILRNTQGLHAPLRISMELKAAKKIGRLPFLTSSNLMHDVLTGRDIELGPEDIFNQPEFMECVGRPHAIVEKSLNLL